MAIHKGGYKKTRRTPEGGAGHDEIFCDFCRKTAESKTPGAEHLPPALPKRDKKQKNHRNSDPQKVQNYAKKAPKWGPRIDPKSAQICFGRFFSVRKQSPEGPLEKTNNYLTPILIVSSSKNKRSKYYLLNWVLKI